MLPRSRWVVPRGERDNHAYEACAPLRPVRRPGARPARGARCGGGRGRDHRSRDTDGTPRQHRAPSACHPSSPRIRASEPRDEPLLRGGQARDPFGGPLAVRRAPPSRAAASPLADRGDARDRQPRRAGRPSSRVHRDDAFAPGRASVHRRREPHAPPRHWGRKGPPR